MREPFSVKGLCAEIQQLVESRYPVVLVEGEIVSAKQAGRGHVYLTLGDRDARIAGIVFAGTLPQLRVRPEAGQRVLCRGRLSFFPPYGQVQLIINEMAPAGEGAMAREIARRRERLLRDGLLDPRRKRPLPPFPKVIGVVTSLTGAALQDFLKVSGQRYPATRILVGPSLVQGPEAPAALIRALDLLQEDGRAELIVITRGGGAKSDLMAFQDEYLARAVAACAVPVISAVGHEIDSSLCDEVADAVAPTPSAAAVLALPDGIQFTRRVDDADFALQEAMARQIARRRQRVAELAERLRHPGDRVRQRRARLEELEERLARGLVQRLASQRVRLTELDRRLGVTMATPLARRRERADGWSARLEPAMARLLERRRARLERAEAANEALSPHAVLERGYAMVRTAGGEVVRSPAAVEYGERLRVTVRDGDIDVLVS